MVVVFMFVESHSGPRGGPSRRGVETDTVYGMRLNRDLNNKLAQRDLGNGQRRSIRDVNKKHHVHMSNERVPAARVARPSRTSAKETENAGK